MRANGPQRRQVFPQITVGSYRHIVVQIRIKHPLEKISDPRSGKGATMEQQGFLWAGSIGIIASPVGDHQVHEAIFIEVTRSNPRHPARQFVEGRMISCLFSFCKWTVVFRRCGFPLLIFEYADGTPLTGDYQFRITIGIGSLKRAPWTMPAGARMTGWASAASDFPVF